MRGFGIHSPRDYDFITTVLYPGKRYGYYAYERIDALYPADRARMRRLFRVLVRLQPRRVRADAYLEPLVKVALPGVRMSDECDLLVCRTLPEQCPEVPVVLVGTSKPQAWGGSWFRCRRMAVFLPDEVQQFAIDVKD